MRLPSSMHRSFATLLLAASAACTIACGESVDTGGSGGSGGSGTTSTTTTATTTSSGTGGDGGGIGDPCGGRAGIACPSNAYCDFPDDDCGADDGQGVCVVRPLDCSGPALTPACGCDGEVHASGCIGYLYGTDIAPASGCAKPAGTFECGSLFCDLATQYCQHSTDDTGGPGSFYCNDLPAICSPSADCACLANESCGSICDQGADGGLTVICPGG